MRFAYTPEQEAYAESLDALLTSADPVSVARAWAANDTAPGVKLWQRLADQGVTALVVPEEAGGLAAGGVELVIAFEALGRHGVPGPWVESAAYLARALAGEALSAVTEGAVGTVAVPPHTPYALDADLADQVYVVSGGSLVPATPTGRVRSIDVTRRLFEVTPATEKATANETRGALDLAFDTAVLACSAQLLGAGERLLTDTVAYVKQRRQFGREIGSYQAVKHALAEVRIALDFARPLVLGAALTLDTTDGARDTSAAKVAAGDAAYLASRAALQLHGAIGYTRELDLSLWITRVRALVSAWGTPAYHRRRVLDSLLSQGA